MRSCKKSRSFMAMSYEHLPSIFKKNQLGGANLLPSQNRVKDNYSSGRSKLSFVVS